MMMGQIQDVAAAICGTLIITAVFMMMSPSASGSKTLRFSASLFFLLSLAAPFAGEQAYWRSDPALLAPEREMDFQSLTQRQLLAAFESRLTAEAEQILADEGITPEGLRFSIHIGEDNRISITSLELLLKEGDRGRCDRGIARLNEAFGLTVQLAFSEDGSGEG
ncbi:MAG: hypothetical protein HFE45_00705 [Oscillospiraceae bacterium]|jgi:hypothetical protein|nr:hypothetical protein [Oscillospiraceae bacterium]